MIGRKQMEDIAKRVAAESGDDPLVDFDIQLDQVVTLVQSMNDLLPKIDTTNSDQEKAVASVKENLETAIFPYLVEILDAMELFEEKEGA